MTEVAKLDSMLIGTKEIKGEAVTTEVAITREVPTNGNSNETIEPVVVAESNTPLVIAEFMPEFPGGKAALVKFLQNNLRQPTDFEDGEKVTVIASFVVNKEGEIAGVKITQKG
jgi:protein TonB